MAHELYATFVLRREVNKLVEHYVEQGVVEVVPGVVFIDEVCAKVRTLFSCRISHYAHLIAQVHMLDIECFTCLNSLLEPVVFATNRGRALFRRTDVVVSPHSVPGNIIDR